MRALLVLVAALLVPVAAVGAAGGLADAPADRAEVGETSPRAIGGAGVPQTDGSATLQQITVLGVPPSAVERSGIEDHYVDLGSGVGLSTDATTDRLRTLEMVERVEAAETREERRGRLRNALRALETEVDDLGDRQTVAIQAYNRGEITSEELLVSLVRIGVAAEELNTRRTRLEALADETPQFDIDRGELASIGNQLSAFTGPVRAHAASVLRGEADPTRFYLATGPESVTLTVVVDDTYLRESYRGDLRNGAGDAIELEVALDIVAASYPTIWNTTREQTQVFGGGETYPVRIAHSRGDLTAFVDNDARVVYAEHQRRPLDTVVADGRAERSVGGVRVTVNHTYPGGPVQIRTVDESTGDPVDADVSVAVGPGDPTPVGTADDDGVHWTLSPNRQYTITVDTRGETVDLVVTPGVTPQIERVTDDGDGGSDNSTATPTPTPAD